MVDNNLLTAAEQVPHPLPWPQHRRTRTQPHTHRRADAPQSHAARPPPHSFAHRLTRVEQKAVQEECEKKLPELEAQLAKAFPYPITPFPRSARLASPRLHSSEPRGRSPALSSAAYSFLPCPPLPAPACKLGSDAMRNVTSA